MRVAILALALCPTAAGCKAGARPRLVFDESEAVLIHEIPLLRTYLRPELAPAFPEAALAKTGDTACSRGDVDFDVAYAILPSMADEPRAWWASFLLECATVAGDPGAVVRGLDHLTEREAASAFYDGMFVAAIALRVLRDAPPAEGVWSMARLAEPRVPGAWAYEAVVEYVASTRADLALRLWDAGPRSSSTALVISAHLWEADPRSVLAFCGAAHDEPVQFRCDDALGQILER